MTNRQPQLGDELQHKVTGFVGIATSYAQHLAGCDRLWLEPRVGEDGKARDGQWVDIDLLIIVRPTVVEPVIYYRKAPGGVDLPKSR